MTDELLVSDLGAVDPAQTWTLNRPRVRNALNPSLIQTMRDALADAERRATQVVLLNGAGPSFCAGADLRFLESHDAHGDHTPRKFLSDIWDLTIALERSPVAFVAALHGHVVAGGLELALACDVVIAADDTLIGDGHVRNNLLPGGGASARMERALGRGMSSWLALSGALESAADPGFGAWLRGVVPLDDLGRRSTQVVQALLRAPASAQARYKRLLHESHDLLTLFDRDAELDEFERHWNSEDVPEALRRFLNSRSCS